MRRVLSLFILLCFGISHAHPPERSYDILFSKVEFLNVHTVRIPLKTYGQLLVIEGQLLGKKGNFIIDTGSETLLLNSVHYTANPRSKQDNAYGVLGSVDNPLQRTLDQFNVEGLVMKNKSSDVIDLSHIEKSKKMRVLGIIGFNVLKDYEIFIDLYLNQITLSKTDDNGDRLDQREFLETIEHVVPFKLYHHSIILYPKIEDKSFKFALDSGSEFNQISKRVVRKFPKAFKPERRIFLSGASGKKAEVLVGKHYGMRLDSIQLDGMQTMMTSLAYAYEAFGTPIDGVLGYEFFNQNRTIINYTKQKLYIVKQAESRDL